MYYDNLKTDRSHAGIRIAALEKASGVSRSTISRIEKHHKSTHETLVKLITGLNDLHYEGRGIPIDAAKHITSTSKFGVTGRDAE